MTLQSNVIAFPSGMVGDLPSDQMQEIRDIGFTHYRRAEGDLIAAMAILRAACLILCDMAMADPDPMATLDTCLGEIRGETEGLILVMQAG
ncbi:hypothetical protein [Paracoccus denitrificans]|uniref:hypothetical protein n=1 Tax=Paracoccus denitrificans TaxID=266 RepID=UPI003364C8AA